MIRTARLLLGALLFVPPALAATERALSLEQMTGLAEEIVVGTVVDETTRWEGRLIVTVSTIEVDSALKGRPESRIEITQLGGSAVHPQTGLAVTMTASSQVAMRPGEEVLLFVARSRSGLRQIVGAAQGKLSIRTNPRTGVKEIPVGPKQLGVTPGPDADRWSSEALTLESMRRRIEAALRAAGRGAGGSR